MQMSEKRKLVPATAFKPGHEKKGGRPPGAISRKRAMAMEVLAQLEEELGRPVNPLEGLLRLGSDPNQPTDVRVTCMTSALPYLYPKLAQQSVALTGPSGEGPVQTVHFDIAEILKDQQLSEAAQDLALALAQAESAAHRREHGLPDAKLLPSEFDR